MSSFHVIYASTSGHTEYVVEVLKNVLQEMGFHDIEMQRVEEVQVNDLGRGDILLLASGTWNTGGVEGQLNPHMDVFLKRRVTDITLKGRKVVVIGLGDERYRYTCRAADHLEEFVKKHEGVLLCDTLRIVNEPYGQEKKIEAWGRKLCSHCSS
ncbi:hypothetical protein A2635_00970 [Candidatus Peribacteria bacterium RIFCSPHIGHO2_01_FULL_51_9]|nr:MAG: hypothetical protein A2635_00970 [Candidatus Peribacteria bacterium RIFCSPHIGHO2_01_FULL_51_9]